MSTIYNYHIKDGRFPRHLNHKMLLGGEGDTIKLKDDDSTVECYIVCVLDHDVYCIGNTETTFPTTHESHERLKTSFLHDIIGKKEFQINYFNNDQTITNDPIFVEAYSKQEAERLFNKDYPDREVYSVNEA